VAAARYPRSIACTAARVALHRLADENFDPVIQDAKVFRYNKA
jgi:hypothetical protein